MATVEQQPRSLDPDKLNAFVFRAVEEVGRHAERGAGRDGRQARPLPGNGRRGALTPAELAERTETGERYAREWLNAQAAGGFVEYDPESGRYTLPPEQAVALTDETAPPTCPASSRSRWAR